MMNMKKGMQVLNGSSDTKKPNLKQEDLSAFTSPQLPAGSEKRLPSPA
jgi:hypothetical protein